MIQLIGYAGLALLMIASIPQTIKTISQGHAHGMTISYLVFLVLGFLILIIYVSLLPKIPIPILINYIVNLIAYSIMLNYKFFPKERK